MSDQVRAPDQAPPKDARALSGKCWESWGVSGGATTPMNLAKQRKMSGAWNSTVTASQSPRLPPETRATSLASTCWISNVTSHTDLHRAHLRHDGVVLGRRHLILSHERGESGRRKIASMSDDCMGSRAHE